MKLAVVGWDSTKSGVTDELVHDIKVISGKYLGDIAAANHQYPFIEVTTNPKEAVNYGDEVLVLGDAVAQLAVYAVLKGRPTFVMGVLTELERSRLTALADLCKVTCKTDCAVGDVWNEST